MAELRTCDSESHKAQHIYYLAFHRKSAQTPILEQEVAFALSAAYFCWNLPEDCLSQVGFSLNH